MTVAEKRPGLTYIPLRNETAPRPLGDEDRGVSATRRAPQLTAAALLVLGRGGTLRCGGLWLADLSFSRIDDGEAPGHAG